MAVEAPAPPSLSKVASAEKPVTLVSPLVSIVIPCCGMLEYTRMCVPSVLKSTRMPYELIFLDIGSLDGTGEYLAGLADGLAHVRIEVVRTPADLGIGKACREALDKCRGEYIVLLNNDTIVTRGWVNQLINLTSVSGAMGVVGPMSNYAAVPQLIESVPYRSGPRKHLKPGEEPPRLVDAEAVQAFADEVKKENHGKWLHTDRLGGFCLMFKREVYKRLTQQGDLNKWTDLSLFDSDIVSVKAKQYGYNLAVCRDLFIHHFGIRTSAQVAQIVAASGPSFR